MARIGATFGNDNRLLQGGTRVLNGIRREELEAVFDQCLNRLDACTQQHREYEE
jgi:hypothetical protein